MRYQVISLILLLVASIPVAHSQEAVFLIRHAEQVHDVEDPPLTADGIERAKAWANIFRDAGIDMVFTSKKMRTKQTGEPIAKALNVPVVMMPRRDIAGLVSRVREEHADDVVLIVSHSKTVPKLVAAFAPFFEIFTIKKDDYGSLFVIVPKGPDNTAVIRLRY